ncbi:MAG TPA: NTP transferase domain-containing protein, partial [Patescibacteria group bacterium]|nr:NTP transferase domain-containing protein [Patescibacteria group bacterium]
MNYKINTGVILAAGQGNRLNALGVPKPLVLVGDQTLIDRNIGQLSGAGVQEIYLVLGHQKQEIKKRVFGDHHPQVDLRFVEPTEAG